jgi:hypothetical protein
MFRCAGQAGRGPLMSNVRPHMHPYSFIVSLRANHPTRELLFLSTLLQMERRHGWTAGDERVTPKGTSLGGTRSQSYWSARVTPEETPSEVWQLEDILNKSLNELQTHEAELKDFFATGGSMNYFIGLYGLRNYGLVFAPELMSRLAKVRVELQLDIYPSQSAA